jgi:hypothetical protein
VALFTEGLWFEVLGFSVCLDEELERRDESFVRGVLVKVVERGRERGV